MYFGYWKENRMHGRGAFKWPCGKAYEGEYKANKRQGFGVFSWPDGRKVKGEWNKGKQQGPGEFFNTETKLWYKGVWEFGKLISFENPENHKIIEYNYNADNDINDKKNNDQGNIEQEKKFKPLQNDFTPNNYTSNTNICNEINLNNISETIRNENATASFCQDQYTDRLNSDRKNYTEEIIKENPEENDVTKDDRNDGKFSQYQTGNLSNVNQSVNNSTSTKKKKKKKIVKDKDDKSTTDNKSTKEEKEIKESTDKQNASVSVAEEKKEKKKIKKKVKTDEGKDKTDKEDKSETTITNVSTATEKKKKKKVVKKDK